MFGINDNGLFWNMAAVFATVWALYYVSQRDLDADAEDGDESGLSL